VNVRPAWGALLLAASCGYSITTAPRPTAVELVIPDNETNRRLHEFDFSRVLARELEDRGVQVNTPDARHTLRGTITRIDEPRIVEGTLDVLRVGGFRVTLELALVERETGRILWRRTHTETAATAPARGRTAEMARQEVFERLARWAGSQFDAPW
jgi:hypothetical protein